MMNAQNQDELNATWNASRATVDEIFFIFDTRRRAKMFSYLIWVILGAFIFINWSWITWWMILLGLLVGFVIGSIISFSIGKYVESKTGLDLMTQIQIQKLHRQGFYSNEDQVS